MPNLRSRPRNQPASFVVGIFAVTLMLAGCTAASAPSDTTPAPTASAVATTDPARIDPLSCGIGVTPSVPDPGDVIEIVRSAAAAEAATAVTECAGFSPGATVTFRLSSLTRVHIGFIESPPTQVGDDGSLSVSLDVPINISTGNVQLVATPETSEPCVDGVVCTEARVYFTVGYAPEELSATTIIDAHGDAPTPYGETRPGDAEDSWAIVGPNSGELTVTLHGSTCETRPTQFVDTGDGDTLELVSEEIVPDIPNAGCGESLNQWITTIAIPEGYEDFTVVTVDNLPSILQ